MSRAASWVPSSATFVFRTPLLPFDVFSTWSTGSRGQLEDTLRTLLSCPLIEEALRIASPSLAGRLEMWRSGAAGEQTQKIQQALVRYFTRMTSRATPFGLFAGYSLGTLGAKTALTLESAAPLVREIRIDTAFLCTLVEALEVLPDVRAQLEWSPNSTLHRLGTQLRLIERVAGPKGRSYRLVAFDDSPHLNSVLAAAQGSTIDGLVSSLLAFDPAIAREDASSFIEELIASQILVSNLEPAMTGEPALQSLRATLEPLPHLSGALARLSRAMETGAVSDDVIAGLPFGGERSMLLQVDLSKPTREASVGADVVAELSRGLDILSRFPAAANDALESFARAFEERYGTREVPLLEALDDESGIGFDNAFETWTSPLLAGLAFPARRQSAADSQPWLLRLFERALTSGRLDVELTDADLARLPAGTPPCAPMVASCEPYADGTIHLIGALGPSAGRLWSRFAQANASLKTALDGLLRQEEARAPHAVHAEVVHLPEDRVGNILSRPVLREFEIPLLARSGAPTERQLPLTDLSIRVENGYIELLSTRLKRAVIPHLTTAHNFDMPGNVAVYRFLGALESQGLRAHLSWNWAALSAAAFLPRVTSGRLVLSLARWNLSRESLRPLLSQTDEARLQTLRALREERRIPRLARLVEGDNELLVDFENPLSVDAFLSAPGTGETIQLREELAAIRGLVASSAEGRFTSELLVPFMPATPPASRQSRSVATSTPVRRRYLVGTECLYLKLYGGRKLADQVLRRLEWPASRWFFIRYADPDPHLRLRFFGDPSWLFGDLLPSLAAQTQLLEREGLLWKTQLDTYEREVERYGGSEGIELAEALFCLDSVVTRQWFQAGHDAEATWRFALRSTDVLLTALGLSRPERLELVARQRQALAREAGVDPRADRHLADTYRARRPIIESDLMSDSAELSVLRAGVTDISQRLRHAPLSSPMLSLASDFLHMHVNRVFAEAQRMQEMVVCDYLTRAYRTSIARTRSAAALESVA